MLILLYSLLLSGPLWSAATPTPAADPTPCGSPWPAVFTPVASNPILSPDSGTWELTSLTEPSVVKYGSSYIMSYSGGWNASTYKPYVGIATSADGKVWTKNPSNPVMGYGVGGVDASVWAVRATLVVVQSTGNLRMYFDLGGGDLAYATTADGGQTWTKQGIAAPVSIGSAVGVQQWANCGFYQQSASVWYCVAEAGMATGAAWQLHLLKSTDGGISFSYEAGPLTSLQKDGVFCSMRAITKTSDTLIDAWYHVNVPSMIWHAKTPDLYNWFKDSAYTLTSSSSMWGMTSVDQVADPSIVEADGKVYIYYDAVSNSNATAKIGMAEYQGTMVSCTQCETGPTPTITPSPIPTPQPRGPLSYRWRRLKH